jgi:NAD(P)-dependent dehydrogenase (short-subunit alcohol dehydrogenase family)
MVPGEGLQDYTKVAVLGIGIATTVVGLVALRRYIQGGVCHSKARLDGKTVIITGANTGIGKETAIDLARRGARVVMACRNPDRAKKALEDICQASGGRNVVNYDLDLASFKSIRGFVKTFLKEEERLDILVNNAGIMRCPYWKTEDGYEMQFGVNHLGHFLLTNLLLDKLKEAPRARIVVVSSFVYKFGTINFDDVNSEKSYDSQAAYGQSKLANNLFTIALADRLRGSNVTVNCLHPGIIRTELGRHMLPTIPLWRKILILPLFYLMIMKTAVQGAQTTIYLVISEEVEGVSGKYFGDCHEQTPLPKSLNKEVAKRLWRMSEDMTGLSKES